MTKATKHEALKCSQSGCDYSTKESKFAKQELGRHLKFTHGIAGSSTPAKLNQQKKALAIRTEQANNTQIEKSAIAEKRSYAKRNSINGYDAQAFITIGYIRYLCEVEAEKLGVPKESFTKRCAELFFASQIR